MFGHESKPSCIYSYAALSPVENVEGIEEQFILSHRFQNRLIEIERARRESVEKKLAELFPELAELDARILEIDSAVGEMLGALKSANATARKRTATKEQRSDVAQKKAELKELRAERKIQRQAAFESVLWIAAQESIQATATEAVKAAQKESGLYWSTYLDVGNRIPRSGAPPKFRRWNGEAKIAVQLQGGLSWDEAASGADTQLRIADQPGGKSGMRLVSIRIGSEGRAPIWATIPVLMHRELPDGCAIKWVYFSRRMQAHHEKYAMHFVVSAEGGFPKDDRAAEGAVAYNFGWRMVPGGLRVAYWFGDDGAEGELILPEEQIARLARAESRQSESDKRFNSMRDELADWLDDQGEIAPLWLREKTEHLRLWRNAGRLYAVRMAWIEQRFEGDEAIFAAMNAWAACSRKNFDAIRGLQTGFQNFRKDFYRKFAAEMSRRYGTVALAKVRLKKLAEQPEADAEEGATYQVHRRIASTSELTRYLTERFAHSVTVDAKHITDTCHACGETDGFDQAANLTHRCSECGEWWDQDANAARNIMARAKVLEPVS